MPQASYKFSEARKKFSEVLERANQGEGIGIMRGNSVYAHIGPAPCGGKRLFALLRHGGLPNDLFDTKDAEQTAFDADDWNDDTGVWQGQSMATKVSNENPAQEPCRLVVDDRQRSPVLRGTVTNRGQGKLYSRQCGHVP